ncbi:plakophilin-1 [Lampris incognitus]|uniref:plakophilin-1 n=1 Tax=Lampris incognitus TaxID=2546036 RepID=UPI0024B4E470|nr:plakophilin-1 [Lampris incognitus]
MAALHSASAWSSPTAEDTSLALPSDKQLRSGQQRVLEQVHTIKRSKSKQARSGSHSSTSPSPSGPSPKGLTVFSEYSSFKFPPAKANGNYSCGTSNKTAFNGAVNVHKSRSLSSKTMGRKLVSTSSQWDQRFNTSTWPQPPNGLKPSRSDPALARSFTLPPAPAMTAKGQMSLSRTNKSNRYSMTNSSTQLVSSQTPFIHPPSTMSQNKNTVIVTKVTKTEQPQPAMNNALNMSDLTLKEAVGFLSHPDENYQVCGACFIQHDTHKEDQPKKEVRSLGGIPVLVMLLRSPNSTVSQSASGALRNVVFKNQANKLEVQHCSGIGKALQLLKETDSTETQKHLTGLLWNLSSADELKGEMIATALPVLTESVVMPFTCWSDNSAINNIHPDVFYSTTGCLRNLSCAGQNERQAMRECRGLIDSLMIYVQSCVAEDNPDDKSVENCVCILHNLTYQLETESPECFAKFNPPTDSASVDKKNSTIGCFSPKSSKVQKENVFDVTKDAPEDSTSTGVKWLCHPKTMQTYLNLLGTAQKDATLEACCGALQNLTASKGMGSSAMSQIMVQKLGALQYISPLLKSPNRSLQKTAMSLVGNLSRTGSLQAPIARQLLPDLCSLLSSGTREMGNSDDTMASACHTVHSLISANAELGKKVISSEMLSPLADLSENRSFPKASKAASVLLYSLWNDKSLQGHLKKLGFGKSLFVNNVTTAAHKSVQVIE